MTDPAVTERLRASKARCRTAAVEDGRLAGRAWVRDRAEVDELEALERWHRQEGGFGFGHPSSAYGDAEVFHSIVARAEIDRDAAAEFWEQVLGPQWAAQADRDAFIEAFAEGALAEWDQHKGSV